MIILTLILIVLINFLIQSSVLPYFPIGGVVGNTSIIIIVCISLFLRKSSGKTSGLLIGLLEDIMFSPVIGARTIVYLILGHVMDSLERDYRTESLTETMILVILGTIGFNIAYYLIQIVFLDGGSLILFLKNKLLKEIIYNSILLIPIKHILYKIFSSKAIRFMEN